jgi:hypothetical protein
MEVNNGRMRHPTVVAGLRGLELDPLSLTKPLISGYTGFNGLFVTLIVRLLVEAVLDLFNGFVFVWHSNPPTDANRRGDCGALKVNVHYFLRAMGREPRVRFGEKRAKKGGKS